MAAGLQEAPPAIPPGPRVRRPVARPRPRRAPRWTRVCVILGAVLVLVSVGTLGSAYALSARYEKAVKRTSILSGDTKSDRGSVTEGPLNFLVLGSDNRAADPSVGSDTTGQRTDTIMLIHVNKALNAAYVVSIPRDSYVDIPASDDGKYEGGKNKINAAFAFGGARLTADTVHDLTGLQLDGAFILDFNSVRTLVSIVGGVWVTIPEDMSSIHTDRRWKKGRNFLTPDAAQDFMRQRKTVAGGDLGRIQNQQRVIEAVAQKLTTKGILANPRRLDQAIITIGKAITADESVNIRDLAFSLKTIRPSALKFVTVPVATDNLATPFGSSVELDSEGSTALYAALRDDTMDQWLALNPQKPAGT
jgi:LCP family protein required for cell wall assembly